MSKQNYSYSTGEQILNQHRADVGDDADTNIEYMQPTALLKAFNDFKRQVWNAPFNGMEIDEQRRIFVQANGKGWDFAEKDQPFSFVQKTNLAAQLTKGSTGNAQLADADDFEDEAGAIVTYDRYGTWDYITYSGVSDPNLTTVGDVGITHASGEEVHKLYKLPDNFARAKKLSVQDDEIHEGGTNPEPGFFCTYNGFLWMPRNFGIATGVLTFYKKTTDITDEQETLDTPDFLDPVLVHLMNARAFHLGGESENMIQRELFAAADSLRQAMGYSVATSNKRIRLARRMPRSPSMMRSGGYHVSRFDEGNYT